MRSVVLSLVLLPGLALAQGFRQFRDCPDCPVMVALPAGGFSMGVPAGEEEAEGVPTPNYFTGGFNFHSRFECLPVPAFLLAYRLTERLVRLAAA